MMESWALLAQVQSNIGATCDRAVRQASLIEARERDGLPTDRERNVLRGIRVSLGLEYHQEAVLLAALAGEAGDGRCAPPARRPCHRGAGEDCPLPVRCCRTVAATLTPWSHRPPSHMPSHAPRRTDSRGVPFNACGALADAHPDLRG